ncbi:MAG: DUF167 domain-containing protein [Methanomassiliicoccaceae archaeon]|nr:DUF167 domain-containing protein [Methanomassiliicoccaceae archaeon]MCL2145637.1 DUF167 domain-containing protein [Methanomassiliicoccaceae archaeon]
MSVEEVVRIRDSGIEVDVLVSPRSSRSGTEGIDGWRKRLIVKVRSPPLDGKANKEVEEVFLKATGSPSAVISGHTSRQKTVFIEGDPAAIILKLREHNE